VPVEGHFVEESRLASARVWRHERTVEPEGAGCRVTDRLDLQPPAPPVATALRRARALLTSAQS
jgi:hypothetical protein